MIRTALPPQVAKAIKATKRRAALVQALRALWPPVMALLGVGALGAVAGGLPDAVVSLIAGVALLGAAWLFYRAITHFAPISDLQAQHLLEQSAKATDLAPLTTQDDRQIGGDGALWAWHQTRLDAAAAALTKPVNPVLTARDGWRILALFLALGVCVWQPVSAARMLSFDLSPLVGDGELVMDAWAVPPDYTGLPVVRLDRNARTVSLPQGSVIHARIDGARGAPKLIVSGQSVKLARAQGQAWTGQAKLARSGTISLDRFGSRATWHATMIQDKPPTLTSAAPIVIDPKGRLDVAFSALDDYGIVSAALRIKARNPPDSMANKATIDTPIALDDSGDPDGTGEGARRMFVDVTQHVLTGLEVDVVLVLRDGLGQETLSPATRLVMPQVKWTTSLGAALQEQRLLILREARPYRRAPPQIATLFDPADGQPIKVDFSQALIGAPENIVRAERLLSATLASLRDTGLSDLGIMGMQFARERLALARDLAGAYEVAPILWELALRAEQSDKTPAQQRLSAARDALEQALKNGASESQIRELSQELREAVKERLDEIAQQGQGQGDGQGDGDGQGGQAGNTISGDEIDKMLSDLERSGESGARRDALEQLAQLGEMMDNLQAGQQGSGDQQSGGSGQANGQNPLDDAMRQQRDLTDDTAQRQSEGTPTKTDDLAQRQEDLANQLGPEQGATPSTGDRPEGPEGQIAAGKQQAAGAMREAARALREGDLSRAQEAQARAEQALQQAAQAQSAQSGGDADQDPLGRRIQGRDVGRGTKVPDQAEKRRARDVREELRRRQADPGRDSQERDYLDRLLKD